MRSLISLVISIACITLCGATLFYPIPHASKVPLFKINEATGCLEFNRAHLEPSHHTTGYVYSPGSKKEVSQHQSSNIFHLDPIVTHKETKSVKIPAVVQFPTDRINIPFDEASPFIIEDSSEYEKHVNLLQTLSTQRDVITSQIQHMAEIQKVDTEQSEVMSSLLRRREFLNFQINSLVSLLGLETKYTTQFQVVGPSPQLQEQAPVVPEYVEKKLLFLEPSDNTHAIYPPTPVKGQTFQSSSIEFHEPISHPNLLRALESQRDAINEALSRLTHIHSQDNTNLYEFYTARRDIINAQIQHFKELEKDHATTDTQKPALDDQNQTHVHLGERLSDTETLQNFEETATPVVPQFPTERVDTPFYEAPPFVTAESSEYEKNIDLLQTLSAQRNVITSQIKQIAEIQKVDTEESEIMSNLLRRREFLNFQINSLVSVLGLETKYSTQFQVVGPSQQNSQQAPIAPQYVEKKLSLESHEIVSHPNLLSALESQRDEINEALSRLTHRHSQDNTNLYEFYTSRRDIINAQIQHLKELQKDHATTDTQKPNLDDQNQTNVHLGKILSDIETLQNYEETTTHSSTIKSPETTTTKSKPASVEKHNKHTAEAQEGDLLAVLVMIRDSLQNQILLLERGDKHQQEKHEDKASLLKALKAECDEINLQISHATANYSTRLSSTFSKQVSKKTEKVVETKKHTEHIVAPHENIGISRRYIPSNFSKISNL